MKKFISLFLVFLIITNSFAAQVSDNDGSSFITKAEFDTLKNEFQTELDSFNMSIDSKIDYAIAAYLAGIRVNNEIDITSALTKEGVYGGLTEYWSSATNKSFDMVTPKYSYEDFTMGLVTNRSTYKVRFVNPEYVGAAANEKCKFGNERDYRSSKNTNIKLSDGSEVDGFIRGIYYTNMTWSYNEMWAYEYTNDYAPSKTGTTWAPSASAYAITNAGDNLIQGISNYKMYAQGGWTNIGTTISGSNRECSGYWGYTALGALTLNTKEVNYNYDNYNVNYPLSETDDYYWDINDKTSHMVSSKKYNATSANIKNFAAGSESGKEYSASCTLSRGNLFNSSYESSVQFAALAPSLYLLHTVPWCTNSIKSNDTYLYHWNLVNNRNRQIKNGMIIGTTKKDGVLKIECQADKVGDLYMIATNTPITNWKDAGFKGKKFNIAVANKDYTFEYGDVKENTDIWCIFLPTDTTVLGILKVKRLIEIVEGGV